MTSHFLPLVRDPDDDDPTWDGTDHDAHLPNLDDGTDFDLDVGTDDDFVIEDDV